MIASTLSLVQTADGQEPAATQAKPLLRIALLTDPHISVQEQHAAHQENFARVIDQVNAAEVDAVLIAGDLTEGAKPQEWDMVAQFIAKLPRRPHMVPGNHDDGGKPFVGKSDGPTADRMALYAERAGPAYYAVDLHARVRLIALNASLFETGLAAEAAQWAFLETELAKEFAGTRLLMLHYPLFMNDPDEAEEYFNVDLGPRRRILKLIFGGKVRAVMSGHLHWPIQKELDGVHFLSAPATSFGLPRDRQPEGWMHVTIYDDGRVESQLRYLER